MHPLPGSMPPIFSHTPCFPSFIPPQVRVDISATCRGDLSVSLKSPSGTVSLLLDTRPNDASTAGLRNWTLMTVHCWGEQPRGLWTLRVRVTHPLTHSPVCLFLLVSICSRSSVRIKLRWGLFQTPPRAALEGLNDGKYEAPSSWRKVAGSILARAGLDVLSMHAWVSCWSSSFLLQTNKNMHISLIGGCKLPPG